jgi:hypothetical protein
MNYKNKLNQIKAVLSMEVKLAQMKLEDGITTIEAEEFEPEYSVGIVTEDGIVPMPVGEYKMEDGKTLVVSQEGIIASISSEEEEVAPETETPEEVIEPEMSSEPAQQIKKIVESVSKETFFAEIEKIRAEFNSQLEELKGVKKEEEQKVELSAEAGAEPIVTNPENKSKVEMVGYAQNRATTITDRVFEKMFNK